MRAWNLLAHALASPMIEGARRVRVRVRGECMGPLLRTGDWIDVRPCEAPPTGGIVVALEGSGQLVCHRVLEARDQCYRLAGDRNVTSEKVWGGAVLGRVLSVERNGRWLRLGGHPPAMDRWLARWQLGSIELSTSSLARALHRGRRFLLSVRAASLWARATGT